MISEESLTWWLKSDKKKTMIRFNDQILALKYGLPYQIYSEGVHLVTMPCCVFIWEFQWLHNKPNVLNEMSKSTFIISLPSWCASVGDSAGLRPGFGWIRFECFHHALHLCPFCLDLISPSRIRQARDQQKSVKSTQVSRITYHPVPRHININKPVVPSWL